jgi:hypothetical protein
MDDLILLSDDHCLLSSQVTYVVALLRATIGGRFEAAVLYSEIIRQMELLHGQLVAHFELEEITAFPQLEEQFPETSSQLQTFLAQHDQILKAFEELRSNLKRELSQLNHVNIFSKATFFELAFERHATSETQLFNDLAKQISR